MIQRWNKRRQVLIDQQKKEAIALTEDRAITLEGEGAIALAEEAAAAIAPGKEGDKPFWSSSTARYCTKELKTAEVDRYLRQFKSVSAQSASAQKNLPAELKSLGYRYATILQQHR